MIIVIVIVRRTLGKKKEKTPPEATLRSLYSVPHSTADERRAPDTEGILSARIIESIDSPLVFLFFFRFLSVFRVKILDATRLRRILALSLNFPSARIFHEFL